MADKPDKETVRSWNLADEVELLSMHPFSNSKRELINYQLEYPTWVARMATVMVEKWGMVAGVPDGEDSSGRMKLRTMTPDELVEHAVTTSEKLVARLRASGHVIKTPSYAEVQATAPDKE